MAARKDENRGTWETEFSYTDWQGNRKRKHKRGFPTKKAALEWERSFLMQQAANLDMSFADFYKVYESDMKSRLKLNTWLTKENIVKTKILPYFGNKAINEITAPDIIKWQNEFREYADENGKPYSQTYLKRIHNEITAIFNHAVRYYELKANPATKAGAMGKKNNDDEMLFWTKTEYLIFADSMRDKPVSYYAYQILYWCGLRLGEMLALTSADFDFNKKTVRVNKSYQRIKGEDIITEPKTPKSKRNISMPDFLCEEIQDYLKTLYGYSPTDRIFQITKSYLHHEMDRGCKESGVKRIRVHDIRHSHVSLLIELGFTAVAIADRVGHESIDITFRYAHLFPSKQIEIADRLNSEGGF